jgi:proton-translocating NADH-quinone oxidoreductase chain N
MHLRSIITFHTADTASSLQLGAIRFEFDGLSLLITTLVLTLGTLVTLYSGPDINAVHGEGKYYVMILLMTGAVINLSCATDLFNLWIWFEMTAISSYLLVGFYRDRPEVLGAAIKYLIQTVTGSILVIFGIALVFLETGTLTLQSIHDVVTYSPLMILAGTFFVIGFGVKFALVPMYTWLPDAYEQAPTGVSALLSGVVTITGLIALLRVLAALTEAMASWGVLLMVFGALNMLVGNLLALPQTRVKRMLAYSSISHTGFILMALGIGIYAGTDAGMRAAMLHLLIHGIMKAMAFLAVGSVTYLWRQSDRAEQSLTVEDLKGLAYHEPLLATMFTISLLSLAGVPPFAGFMSKWLIFSAGVTSGVWFIDGLIVFATVNSIISLGYYLPVINAIFKDAPPVRDETIPGDMRMPIILMGAIIIVLGFSTWPIQWLLDPASDSLVAMFAL